MPPHYHIELEEFGFPDSLGDSKANFRLQVDLRYEDAAGKFAVETAVLPGLHVYWECSKKENKENKNEEGPGLLVRKNDQPSVDLEKAGPWGKRLRLSAVELYELRVTVFDVDREDWYEKLGNFIKGGLGVLGVTSKPLEPLMDGIATGIGKLLVRGDGKVLIVLSADPKEGGDEGVKAWTLKRCGYCLKFTAKRVPAN